MRGPEVFRSHADECMRLARDAADPHHKSLLLSMAQSWVLLADSAEEMQDLFDRRERVTSR